MNGSDHSRLMNPKDRIGESLDALLDAAHKGIISKEQLDSGFLSIVHEVIKELRNENELLEQLNRANNRIIKIGNLATNLNDQLMEVDIERNLAINFIESRNLLASFDEYIKKFDEPEKPNLIRIK